MIAKKLKQGDILFNIFNYSFLLLVMFSILYPLYFILIASFSSPAEVARGHVLLFPVGFNVNGYVRIFSDEYILRSYLNTFIYTTLGTFFSICLTMTVGYALSVKTLSIRKYLLFFFMFTMYFNGGLIPFYILANKLHLVNNWYAMVIIGAISVFNVIIAKTFIENNIPIELFEAASINGCGHIQYFFKFVIPLSKSVIAVLTLYYGIGNWNEFWRGLIFLNDKKLYPLQLVLRSILIEVQSNTDMLGDVRSLAKKRELAELIKYGVIVVASVPMLLLYPFVQKYFTKGVMIGSVKG